MIKHVNRYEPHMLQIDSFCAVFTIMPYEPKAAPNGGGVRLSACES
jgi:hypothetical protein